jgi:uncharacterized protein YjeT (DUF2065 family)
MLDLEFWYLFFGVLLISWGSLFIFVPREARRTLKSITRRTSTVRFLATGIITMSVLLWYSTLVRDGLEKLILLVVSYLALLKGLTFLYFPKWLKRNVFKFVLNFNDWILRALGIVVFLVGILSGYFGIINM